MSAGSVRPQASNKGEYLSISGKYPSFINPGTHRDWFDQDKSVSPTLSKHS